MLSCKNTPNNRGVFVYKNRPKRLQFGTLFSGAVHIPIIALVSNFSGLTKFFTNIGTYYFVIGYINDCQLFFTFRIIG